MNDLLGELRVELATTLREQREAAGLTQAQLGLTLGCDQAMVSRMERPHSGVSFEKMLKALLTLSSNGVEMKVGGRYTTAVNSV